ARIQSNRGYSSSPLGYGVFANPLCDSVLLQLLVRVPATSHRSQLEPAELSATDAQPYLSHRTFSLDADCGNGDAARARSRLPACLLRLVPRTKTQRPSLSTGHHPALGQLSGPWVCLEDDS